MSKKNRQNFRNNRSRIKKIATRDMEQDLFKFNGRSPSQECFKKKRYSTENFAQKIANKIKWKRNVKLRVYFCDLCGGFHLTKKDK